MTTIATVDNSPTFDPVDWENVRAVYKKVHADFHVLTRPFGIQVSQETDRDLAHLICVIDSVDRCLDEIETGEQRKAFSEELLCYLSGKTDELFHPSILDELRERLGVLFRLICRRDIQARFCATVKSIFEETELKRQATSPAEMISHLKTEWRLTGVLTTLVLGQPNAKFEKFFYLCCEMMTAVDTIEDAKIDFESGQLTVPPSFGLYFRLVCVFLLPMPKLFWRFPDRLSLLRYAASFIRHEYFPARNPRESG